MSYLGRPSAGDSPMAIGDRAMRDTSSPQPPSQRNPTPKGMPAFGTMSAPSPYGAVSDEARRRYEERYAKKRQQEADKAAQEAREQAQQIQGGAGGGGGGGSGFRGPQQLRPPPQQQQQQQQWQQPPPQQQQQQQWQQPPSQQQHWQPPPSQQRQPPQQQQQPPPRPPQLHVQQGPPGGYPQHVQQQHQQHRMSQSSGSGYTSPPPPQHQQHHQLQQQQQQRHSQQGGPLSPGLGGWSQKAVPPPDQAWNRPTQTPPPPVEQPDDHELRSLFSQFDSSRTGQLNSYDLQRLLAKDATMEAREDCVKMLMNIFDTDKSGTIGWPEFEGLYRYIKDWHGIFLRFDRDNSGTIDRKELHAALLGFGFSLPPEMVRRLEKKFAPPLQPGQEGSTRKGISFDRFLLACVTVKHYTEAFRRADEAHQGRVTLDYNQFMDMVMEAPS